MADPPLCSGSLSESDEPEESLSSSQCFFFSVDGTILGAFLRRGSSIISEETEDELLPLSRDGARRDWFWLLYVFTTRLGLCDVLFIGESGRQLFRNGDAGGSFRPAFLRNGDLGGFGIVLGDEGGRVLETTGFLSSRSEFSFSRHAASRSSLVDVSDSFDVTASGSLSAMSE